MSDIRELDKRINRRMLYGFFGCNYVREGNTFFIAGNSIDYEHFIRLELFLGILHYVISEIGKNKDTGEMYLKIEDDKRINEIYPNKYDVRPSVMIFKDNIGSASISIVKTKDFLGHFIGNNLSVWGPDNIVNKIERFNLFEFTDENTLFDRNGIILKGENTGNEFSIECHKGFGFRPPGNEEVYWIDRINKEEAVVITWKVE